MIRVSQGMGPLYTHTPEIKKIKNVNSPVGPVYNDRVQSKWDAVQKQAEKKGYYGYKPPKTSVKKNRVKLDQKTKQALAKQQRRWDLIQADIDEKKLIADDLMQAYKSRAGQSFVDNAVYGYQNTGNPGLGLLYGVIGPKPKKTDFEYTDDQGNVYRLDTQVNTYAGSYSLEELAQTKNEPYSKNFKSPEERKTDSTSQRIEVPVSIADPAPAPDPSSEQAPGTKTPGSDSGEEYYYPDYGEGSGAANTQYIPLESDSISWGVILLIIGAAYWLFKTK